MPLNRSSVPCKKKPRLEVSDTVDGNIKEHDSLPAIGQQVYRASLQEWQNIPQVQIQRIVGLIYQRCQAAAAEKGET